ncbi:SDR family oxidoreductase (plasmid) [Agrobacterium tumefaciens]|uniref:SDR family oxidoreductase n=1 Tax=Agrobacterium tumefaciens TaxID=358 RepID=UPI001571B8A4|nr:SDR family oxidoreductase [Agrobacterium tumefaciens]NSZ66145.1 SDR family oxidoreductase [Agrobacterium tumefaciens]NTA72516.1 SDR family oxidoreductase [Agrobacterium tumefaciens]WIE41757.1 SDR family oxidoreductase [Agrobacterium tumefaciens]
MDLGLKNRTALVLGAGGGLGGAIALSLAREGALLAVADISLDAAEATVSRITEEGGRAISLQWDLADLDVISTNITRIEAELGSVAVLVNNTGGPPPTPAEGQKAELWVNHFNAMVLSVIKITDAVLPGMKERGWGRIITSTSSGVIAPIPNLAVSNALRMSLVGWSKSLAAEIGRFGITTNIVLPGRIATQRITFLDEQKASREGRSIEQVSAASVATIPMGRYGEPSEYGDVVTFLASIRASYLTGSTIRIDGGMIASV